MGLSVMEDAPGADQQLRYANVAGHSAYIPPNAWVGENSLMGLGLEGDNPASSDFQGNVNAVTQGVSSLIQSVAPLFHKKSKNRPQSSGPRQMQSPPQSTMTETPSTGSGANISKLLIYGGVALLGATVLYMVLKKKKKKKHRHLDESEKGE